MTIKNNIKVYDQDRHLVYEGHNVSTYMGVNAFLRLLSGAYDSTTEGRVKYLFFGNDGTSSASADDTALDTGPTSSNFHYYVVQNVAYNDMSGTNGTAEVTYTFVVPQADTFSYREIGLAANDDATFDPKNATTPHTTYILYARHTLPSSNLVEDTTELTFEWTVSIGLDQ